MSAPRKIKSGVLSTLFCQAGIAVYTIKREGRAITWLHKGDGLVENIPEISNLKNDGELTRIIGTAISRARIQWMQSDIARNGAMVTEFPVSLENKNRSTTRWLEETLTFDSETDSFVGMLRDITSNKEREARLDYLASYDQLTGQLNRTRMREYLAHSISHSLRYNNSTAFLAIAVDNLGGINDAYGFDIADEVIALIGQQIEDSLRGSDIVGRIGNAKFGLVLGNADMRGAEAVIQRLQHKVRNSIIKTQAGAVAVTISAGAVLIPEHVRTTHDALTFSMEALTQAKNQGPDSFAFYSPSPQKKSQRLRNISVAEQVMTAIEEKRVLLAFQPIVCAEDTSKVKFHECLIRMKNRDKGFIPAGEFMSITEKLGIVRVLDRESLSMAFDALARAQEVSLSLNISPQSVLDSCWIKAFDEHVEKNPGAAERLILEITEATAILDTDKVANFINRLKERGCSIALDDFGAGYTSFRHLKELKFDMVKIDGSFIRGLSQDKDNQLFVKTLIEIARNFSMYTVAEYVNTDEDADMLRDMGIDYLQGFHYGEPQVEPDWLKSSKPSAISA